jgi:hypothetical protein
MLTSQVAAMEVTKSSSSSLVMATPSKKNGIAQNVFEAVTGSV